jgi:multimeric flavodoxin WrbA
MGKKIIILNGSPRPGGNTAGLIEAFTAGAESAGHTVTRFDIQQMNVQPCLGCLRGGSVKDGFCTQCDDMDLIYPVYEEAGIFVFASPLYYYTFSAQFFTALNRLFAVTEARGMKTPHKECCLLMAAEEDTEEAFAPVVAYYNTLMKNLGWKDIGRVLAGGVNEVGDIAGKPILENARKLGATL